MRIKLRQAPMDPKVPELPPSWMSCWANKFYEGLNLWRNSFQAELKTNLRIEREERKRPALTSATHRGGLGRAVDE